MSEPNASAASGKSQRTALIAVVVGIGVIVGGGIAAGMILLNIQRAREAANRMECVNNLKILGIALHSYHDTNNLFPTEAGDENSLFVQTAAYMYGRNPTMPTPIKSFLCPTRRTVEMAPMKRDYGYATSQPPAWSVMNNDYAVALGAVRNTNNGTSRTLLLTHLWMAPASYTGGDPTDLGWHTKNNARSVNDSAKRDNDPTGSIHHIGSPHKNVMPCLFADGHVQTMPYDFSFWAQAWAWNNTQPFELP